ncbi:MAG: M12 family metallo-peptidase [Bacteroidota bacterium]
MKIKVLVFAAFILSGTNSWAQSSTKQGVRQAGQSPEKNRNTSLFKILENSFEIDIKKDIKDAVFLEIDFVELARINKEKPASLILDLPLPNNGNTKFFLNAVNIVSDNFSVITGDNKKVDYTPGLYYQGTVAGSTPSLAAWSFFENNIMTVFSYNNQNYTLGLWKDKSKNSLNNIYILYKNSDVLYERKFECHTDESAQNNTFRSITPENPQAQFTNCIKIYFECDYQMYLDKGSNIGNVANYVTGMFNFVQMIFSNESVGTNISQIYVWSAADPYISDTTTLDQINSFVSYRTTYNGNAAHLLSTRFPSQGGRAFNTGTLCDPGSIYAVSNIYNIDNSVYPNYMDEAGTICHELGHNFGSHHTHWCGWPGGAIDDCAPTEGGCLPGPTPPINGGTIMSYCYATVGMTVANGFGQHPGDAIRAGYVAATCLTSCTGALPVADFTVVSQNSCSAPFTATFTDQSNNSPTSWAWDIDNNGTTDYTTQFPTHTYTASGTYTVKLTVTNANGSNSLTKTDYIVISSAALPFTEDFENVTFPPEKWSVTQTPVDVIKWQRNTTAAGNGASTGCAFMRHYFYGSSLGEKDNLISTGVSLLGATSAAITFKVAYKNVPYPGYYDTLRVFVSTDCGSTYGPAVYTKGGPGLATGTSTSEYTPNSAGDWRTETISLNSFAGNNVVVKFETINRWGNDLYLDDINITGNITTGIENLANNAVSVSIYPNPFSTMATIEIKGLTQLNCELRIYDLLGKEVLKSTITNSKSEIHKEDLSNGIYLFKVFNKNELVGKGKIIVE